MAVTCFLISLISWSLYPLLASFGLMDVPPITFVLITQIAATVATFFIGGLLFADKKQALIKILKQFGALDLEQYAGLILVGLCFILNNLCFIFALTLMDKAGATIIYEAWPIAALLLSPLIVKKQWQDLRYSDLSYAVISFIGLICIVLADQGVTLDRLDRVFTLMQEVDFKSLIGALAAYIGAISLALATLIPAEVSNIINKRVPEIHNTLASATAAEMICRIAALPFTFALFFILEDDFTLTQNAVISASLIGVVVIALSSVTYTVAFLRALYPNFHVYWFLLPVLSVLWLEAFGFSEITPLMLIGALMIILSNIVMTWQDQRSQISKSN